MSSGASSDPESDDGPPTHTLTPEGPPSHESAQPSPLHVLHEKYRQQEKELDRLEKQNSEYREHLIRTIRERDLNEELLKNVRQEQSSKIAELEKKTQDLESQLRVTKDRAAAQETHYHNTTKDLTQKFNAQVAQLTKKQETAEREKNEAVVKYAMKEAEVMRLSDECRKKETEMQKIRAELEEVIKSANHQRLEELERSKEELSVELEKVKHERFDLENRLKISEKRVEGVQLAVHDQKQQNEVMRRQMMQLKEEKASLQETARLLEVKIQADGQKKCDTDAETNRALGEREALYRNVLDEVSRSKALNRELNERVEDLSRENSELLTNLQTMEARLRTEEEVHASLQKQCDSLLGIEHKVNSSLEEARRARLAQEEAESDRATADAEAEGCRRQAERMLEITEQLTRTNTQLSTDLEDARELTTSLQQRVVELEGSLKRAEHKLADMESTQTSSSDILESEVLGLKENLARKTSQLHELQKQKDDEASQAALYKKKASANIKELKSEVSLLRKQVQQMQHAAPTSLDPIDLPPAPSSGSRTSSITSMDQVGRSSEASFNMQSPVEETPPAVQQAMVEKIVKLQKQLARRTEKIEFLEEHVKQCLEELQKKTKIIQYFALREEASLLLPADSDMKKLLDMCEVVQVPIMKKGAAAYSLMGSMWTTGSDKSALQLATEVNSRLQAVLEETLLKNIALKSSVDSLGEEISRLSRENRQLSLRR